METSPSTSRSTVRIVVATVLLSLLWPALQVAAYGSFDALLGVGPAGPALEQVTADIGDLTLTDDVGHDGQQFYVISRHPLDPAAAEDAVVPLAYRYRRILYPAIGSVFAPNGGRQLIVVFLLESLAGVAIGAWALTRLPGGPRWLPLTMAFTPGVIAALGLSLSDALAAGLGLLAVAMALERRWLPMLATLALAALTRETLLIVAVGLAFSPGMTRQLRVATVAVPTLIFGAWAAWSANAASASASSGGAAQLAFPFAGWLSPQVGTADLVLGAVSLVLLVAGAMKARAVAPQITVILALGAVMFVCLSELVTFNWVNSMRPIAPLVPLAFWAIFRESDAKSGQVTEMVSTTAPAGIAP